jgi:cytochrome c5
MQNFLKYLLFILASVIFIVACNENANEPITAANNESTNLNAIQTALPDVPGYETFKMNCLSCHSAKYIQMQPDLPEKTWATIVTKMQKSFGAPIADSAAKEIVQYLTTIKGKK